MRKESLVSHHIPHNNLKLFICNIPPGDHEHYLDDYLKKLQGSQAQSMLEAKIASYKIYDDNIISLINENGWIADHVSNIIIKYIWYHVHDTIFSHYIDSDIIFHHNCYR